MILKDLMKMINPLITISLCSRNAEKTILTTLRSIENLDYPKNRIRISYYDDSEDLTPEIFKDWWEKNHHFYYLSKIKFDNPYLYEKNIPRARNETLEDFIGDYCFFIDADVEIPPESLKVCLDKMNSDSKIGLVCIPYAYKKAELFLPLRKGEVNNSLGSTLVCRKSLELINFKLDEKYKVGEDLWLHCKLISKGLKGSFPNGLRSFHHNKYDYLKHCKNNFFAKTFVDFLLFKDGIAPSEMKRRYAFYSLYLFLILGLLFSFIFSTALLKFFVGSLFLLTIVGIIHYGGLRFFYHGLPMGITLILGMSRHIIKEKLIGVNDI